MKVYFGAGCFWGPEEKFSKLKVKTTVGYMGGRQPRPSYEDVCYRNTGHTEVVEVTYDETRVKFEELLDAFFTMHECKREAKDQYKSIIFYQTPDQREIAKKKVKALSAKTEVKKATRYWIAEEYHQAYYKKHKILNKIFNRS